MTRSQHIQQELEELSEKLSSLPVSTPYRVPFGYFDNLAASVLKRIKTENSAEEELKEISPLLAGLKKSVPYSVPDKYFETLSPVLPKEEALPAKVISFSARKVFRYAAAAVTVGAFALAAWFFFNTSGSDDQVVVKNEGVSEQQVQQKINSATDNEIAAFVEEGSIIYWIETPVITDEVAGDDVQLMLAEVSEEELEKYLNQLNPNREILN